MTEVTVAVVLIFIVLFSMFGKSADRWNVSPPMVFITAGIITGLILSAVPGVQDSTPKEIVLLIAELTLIIILFHDASTVQLRDLYINLPLRMLGIGLPITLLLLYYVTRELLPDIGFNGALLVAAALTPTDAGLGAPTIMNPVVPSRIRQALNVESGINDGLITPIVFIAIAGLAGNGGSPDIPKVALIPISIAIGLAVIVTPPFSIVMDYSAKHKWSTHMGRSIALVMYPLLMWALSVLTGANSFIAAFLAGGVFGFTSKQHHADHALAELLEAASDFLSYCAWFFAGELLVVTFSRGFEWQWVLIAFLALLPFRMIPVYISLLGSGIDFYAMSFLGWFGPRGLATVIFALLTVEELELHGDHTPPPDHEIREDKSTLNNIVGPLLLTVLISVFAHGYSAAPLAGCFGAYHAKKMAKISAKEAQSQGIIDLNPELIVRTRGKGHVISKNLVAHHKSMNMGRYVGAFQSGGRLSGSTLDMGLGGMGGEEEVVGEDDLITMPYTKTANTTVIRKGSGSTCVPHHMEVILEEPDSKGEDSVKFSPGEHIFEESHPNFMDASGRGVSEIMSGIKIKIPSGNLGGDQV